MASAPPMAGCFSADEWRNRGVIMSGSYVENLIKTVIDNSRSCTWDDAVLEWKIDDCEEDEFLESACICGKENLRYLYTIRNKYNGNTLFPIGSSCIKKFGREDLSRETSVHEAMFNLLHAIQDRKFISLTSEFFSRKLLWALYTEGAFDTDYNDYDGEQDYEFMLQMFNKRNKDSISSAQDKKIKAIIVNSIRPFLNTKLESKIRQKQFN